LAERIAPILYAWIQKELRNRERMTAEKILSESALRYKHLAEDLSAANQELESFSYSVSHDLRSPLRAIKGFSGFLLEDYSAQLDDTGKDYLNRIIKGSERMDRLIDDMLHLSRVSRQEMLIHEMNLASMAASIFEDLRYSHPERSVSVFIDEHIPATGDSRLLTIVMTNLLSNAWKYTAKTENPRIEFRTEKRDGQQVFVVRDNGSGFNPRYADNLFAPFKRLHSDTEFPGTGIGLAIVLRAIKRHRGHIWAESEVGKGAKFYFTLGVDEHQIENGIPA
jgi:light-regulated signal transduction histidine kinase (bacteriophytochrome)